MDIRKRLTRKPMTTAVWVLLVMTMAVLLSVGAAMMYSSAGLAEILDGYHTSIAVRTDRGRWEEKVEWSNGEILTMMKYADKSFTEEDEAWFEGLECVEDVYFHTLTAAYSPELVPAINPADYMDTASDYARVFLVGELTELAHVVDYSEYGYNPDYVGLYGILHLEQMIQEHNGFTRRNEDSDDYLNFQINIPKAYLDEIQEGRRYVLYGGYESLSHGMNFLSYGVQIESEHPWLIVNSDSGMLNDTPAYVETYDGDTPIYGIPYIKPIDGTLEAFLADPENELFVQAIERLNKQHHSLVVLGTENVNALHSFVSNGASVTQGRTFSEEEYASGAHVCMISETVANQSGIQVGDTVTLSQFLCQSTAFNPNQNPSISERSPDGMQNNPEVGKISMYTEYAPAEEFTVVGLYRIGAEWADTSYAFTPNTVLIPKAAQIDGAYGGYSEKYVVYSKTDIYGETATLEDVDCEGTFGIYFSIKLKNGMVSEFEELMASDERFQGEFLTIDQGFGAVMDSLDEISASTAKLTGIILVGWVLLLAVYVLLYQSNQRKNIGIMRCLGASSKDAAHYLWLSGLAAAAIGIAAGTAVSSAVMRAVQRKLLDTAIVQLPSQYSSSMLTAEAVQMMMVQSQLPVWMMLLLAAAQIAVFALALWLHARHLTNQPPRELLVK